MNKVMSALCANPKGKRGEALITCEGFTFAATQITLKPISAKGETYFAERFGKYAVSANLTKSGALRFQSEAAEDGIQVSL